MKIFPSKNAKSNLKSQCRIYLSATSGLRFPVNRTKGPSQWSPRHSLLWNSSLCSSWPKESSLNVSHSIMSANPHLRKSCKYSGWVKTNSFSMHHLKKASTYARSDTSSSEMTEFTLHCSLRRNLAYVHTDTWPWPNLRLLAVRLRNSGKITSASWRLYFPPFF